MPEQPTHPPKSPPPPFRPRAVFTIARFADELGISERSVRRLIDAEKIRTVPISIGRIGIPAAELEKIVAGNLLKVEEDAA